MYACMYVSCHTRTNLYPHKPNHSNTTQCCNHPYLFTGVEDRTLDPLGDHVVTNCGKMFLLDKLLKKLKEKGHRVLVFCQVRCVGCTVRSFTCTRVASLALSLPTILPHQSTP